MVIFDLGFFFIGLSINFWTCQDKNVCIFKNEFNKYHYNYYFTKRSFICVHYWKLMFLGEGTRLLASLVKNGRSVELMRNVVKCQGIPPLVAMVSSEHLVMQNEALVALTLISSTVLGLSSQGRIENCKLSLVLWCFRFHFLMHIWSLTSVEFNEHFWDMVKFSVVFIKKIFR